MVAVDIREKDLVRVRGEDGEVYRVKFVLSYLQAAMIELPAPVEKWVRPDRIVPLSQLELLPPDLEDFPC